MQMHSPQSLRSPKCKLTYLEPSDKLRPAAQNDFSTVQARFPLRSKNNFNGGHMPLSGESHTSSSASAILNAEARVVFSRVPNPALAWLQKAGDGHIRGAQSTVDGVIVVLSFLISFLL